MTCTQINEPSDPDTWSDNYLCTSRPIGLQWSYAGKIDGMNCTSLNVPSEPGAQAWADNYLCLPSNSAYTLTWSTSGPVANKSCVQISEAADHDGWTNNYLCFDPAVTVVTGSPTNSSILTADPATGTAPLSVKFTANVNQGLGVFQIDFGDNSLSQTFACTQGVANCPSSWTVNHTYASNGQYTAKLQSLGTSDTIDANCAAGSDCATIIGAANTQIKTVLGTASVNVAAKTCPTGQTLNNGGQCVPNTCPTGQTRDNNGACVAITCDSGKVLDTNGNCVVDVCPNIDGVQTSVPSDKVLTNGQCVAPPPPAAACTSSKFGAQVQHFEGLVRFPLPGSGMSNLEFINFPGTDTKGGGFGASAYATASEYLSILWGTPTSISYQSGATVRADDSWYTGASGTGVPANVNCAIPGSHCVTYTCNNGSWSAGGGATASASVARSDQGIGGGAAAPLMSVNVGGYAQPTQACGQGFSWCSLGQSFACLPSSICGQ